MKKRVRINNVDGPEVLTSKLVIAIVVAHLLYETLVIIFSNLNLVCESWF